MAVIKKKTRKRLSKQLKKIVKKHGAEMTLALVTGIVTAAAGDSKPKIRTRLKAAVKPLLKATVLGKRTAI